MIIDTAGSLMHEGVNEKTPSSVVSESKFNPGEADLVIQTIKDLMVDLKLKSQDIGVISPYNAQVNLVRKLLKEHDLPGIEVSTVDGF